MTNSKPYLGGSSETPSLFAARQMPSLPLDRITFLSGNIPFVDDEHPDHLDWRSARLAVDINEGRWLHFIFLPKEGGRPASSLAKCPILSAKFGIFLNRLFDAVLPDRDTSILKFPDGIVSSFAAQDKSPTLSFHGNAKSQKAIQGFSNHDWMKLSAGWAEIKKHQSRRREAGTA